jgi:hypothetical protein
MARFRTNYQLWTAIGGCLFIALGFVDPLAGAGKGDNRLWANVVRLVHEDFSRITSDMVLPILLWGVILAIPAAALGWVFQAIVVVTRTWSRTTVPGCGKPSDG